MERKGKKRITESCNIHEIVTSLIKEEILIVDNKYVCEYREKMKKSSFLPSTFKIHPSIAPSKETHTNYVTNTEITEATASVRSSRESLARSASGPRNNLCLWERATSDVPYLPRNLLADKTPVSHQPGWRRGAKGRGIEGRDVSACRSGLFILSPADTPAMILTRRGEAFSPKEKKRRKGRSAEEGEICHTGG